MARRINITSFDIDEDYFEYLCQYAGLADPEMGYLGVLREMYDTEFSERTAKLVVNDSNRLADIDNLRRHFEVVSGYEDCSCIRSNPYSVLELMVELAYNLKMEFGILNQKEWFMEMFENLGLIEYPDDLYFTPKGQHDVYHILRDFRYRKYGKDGRGGLFPLRNPQEDQRKKEIWRQAGCYFVEKFL